MDAGVVLDEILELLENGNQLLLADLVDVFDMVAEPVFEDAVVCGQPCSRPGIVRIQPIMYDDLSAVERVFLLMHPMLVRNVVVVSVLVDHVVDFVGTWLL